MAVVCPRCSNIYDPVADCPRCGASAPAAEREPNAPGHGPRWQQTSWGRILIGLIVSQGLFYGLRRLLTGVLLAYSGGSAQDAWENVEHLLLWQAIQAVGLLAGGLLAGGGQRNGLAIGAIVGAWNGALAVLFRQNPGEGLTVVGLYGLPLLHAALAALGGWVGSSIWRPIPAAAVPAALLPPRKPVKRPRAALLAGKVHWLRVLAGSAFVVTGTLSATMLFQKVMDVSGHRFGTTSHETMDRLITWEIRALAVLVGGAFAGATTSNGLKQGLFAGFLSGFVLIGAQAPHNEAWPKVAGLILLSTLSLTTAGGWFGGQLFPPVMKFRRRDLGLPSW